MKLIKSQQFEQLILEKWPLLDVRAEIEFSKGAFPGAFNAPILKDSERQKVGRCNKIKGPEAAVELGHQIVSGKIKTTRLNQWLDYIKNNPNAVIYCFRGGMRSQLTQQWIQQSGIQISRVEGGYKALRSFLLNIINEFATPEKLIVVGGRTGTGKTRVIQQLQPSLDLERLANHRGSAFGKQPGGQPSQIDFENLIAVDLLRLKNNYKNKILIEDESKLIGKNALPFNLKNAMSESELVIINEPIKNRVEVVTKEYVSDLFLQYQHSNTDLSHHEVWDVYASTMLLSLKNISKKIGADRYRQLENAMQDAMDYQLKSGSTEYHRQWIEPLLTDYYDKMYDYQLNKKKNRVIYEGNRKQVIHFLKEQVLT